MDCNQSQLLLSCLNAHIVYCLEYMHKHDFLTGNDIIHTLTLFVVYWTFCTQELNYLHTFLALSLSLSLPPPPNFLSLVPSLAIPTPPTPSISVFHLEGGDFPSLPKISLPLNISGLYRILCITFLTQWHQVLQLLLLETIILYETLHLSLLLRESLPAVSCDVSCEQSPICSGVTTVQKEVTVAEKVWQIQ